MAWFAVGIGYDFQEAARLGSVFPRSAHQERLQKGVLARSKLSRRPR